MEEEEKIELRERTKDEETSDDVGQNNSVWKLYCSRALTAWGDRLWQFGLALMLFNIMPDNFFLVAIYGLVINSVSIFSGAMLGNWIDSSARLRTAQICLIVQNSMVAINCLLMAAFFYWRVEAVAKLGAWVPIIVATLAIALAVLSSLASTGSKIVVEKDWIVVISANNPDRLAKLNSIFRTIDLVCLSATPALAGLLFQFTNYTFTALCIGGWNVISVVLEYLLLVSIYHQYNDLARPKKVDEDSKPGSSGLFSRVFGSYKGWTYYFTHKFRNAGLGLACLYLTVLGLDSITWSFSLTQCVPELVLGLCVGVSAFLGILGSTTFPVLRARLGTERAGLVGMVALVSSLSLCVASVWLPGSPFEPGKEIFYSGNYSLGTANKTEWKVECEKGGTDVTSVSVLLTGMLLARFGLWLSDLSITQILQQEVTESKRGVVGGVQSSLNSTFDLVRFILVLFLPDPHTFGILIIISFSSICLGALSLAYYAAKVGKLSCNNSKEKG